MGYILTIYSENVYQEFLLPALNNADYSIVLPWKAFSLYEDITLNMEVFNHKWRFVPGNGYSLLKEGKAYEREYLKNQDILMLKLYNSLQFAVMVQEKEIGLSVFQKYLLPPKGRIEIGKKPGNQICYDALGRVSGSHAAIEISQNNYILRDTGSKNGVYVNHNRIKQMHVLQYGDMINIIGLKIVFLGSFIAVDTNVPNLKIDENMLYPLQGGEIMDAAIVNAPESTEGEGEKKYFNRIPRSLEQIDEEAFVIEGPPAQDHSQNSPWYLTIGPSFTMAIPMTLGCVMSAIGTGGNSSIFMYTGLITAFGSALIGTGWAIARMKYEKKRRAEIETHRLQAYQEYLDEKDQEIGKRYAEDIRVLNERYPSADVLCAQNGSFQNLWNRNATHRDFMYHRIGMGSLPFSSEISIPQKRFVLHKDELMERPQQIKDKYKDMKNVPIGVDLLEHPLIGIVGGARKQGAFDIAKLIITQIAASNCYTDVKIALTYDKDKNEEREAFEMFRWLPHTWSVDKKSRYVAGTKEEAADIYYELTQILRKRVEEDNRREKLIPKPLIVLFVSDLHTLNNELISKYVFNPSIENGLITVLLVEHYEELPNNCEYIIENSREAGRFTGVYSVRGEDSERREVSYDTITNASAESFARTLADVEVEEMELGGEIPSSITFFEMMGISKLDELDVLSRWMKNRTYESMRALLGQKSGGEPCYLDVHEKYHGPHGLVAGTTGSGKSETLQTYMLSLAINYSPDDIGFFIIDYKGGGMANLFNGLPHLMGQISNLSGNQIRRAMVSIKSENRRRQRVFNEHGVNNINSYTKLIKSGEAKLPVPHLFIIIDEFAELKREEPDFMRELISVAQVGRSLGVHLILATQKPSGTVDDNIWSNSKFRLCLRVQDKQDSSDMLHKPDAAYITQAGRGYLQIGNDELYELFQSGWSGAAYDENSSDGKVEAVKMYTTHGHAAIVGNRLKLKQQEQFKMQWIRRLTEVVERIFKDIPDLPQMIQENTVALQQTADMLRKELEKMGIEYSESNSNRKKLENLLILCAESSAKSTDGKTAYIMDQEVRRGMKLPETKQKSQLDAIVEYLATVAVQNGYNHQYLLWLPVLPENLYLTDLAGYKETGFASGKWSLPKKWDMKACIGLCDDPANQSQTTLELDFGQNGHLIVIGAVGTGKSTFLQTMVYSLAHRYNPEYVNFYCMDFSSNLMRGFEKLVHVGGVMYENDLEAVSRCFNMLESILQERKIKLKGGNYEQYVQAHGVEIPAIFLVIDKYSNFREKTNNIYEELLIRLSRDGAACGIYLVISAAGFGMSEIPYNIGKNIKEVICLEMGDKFQYADVLHTMQIPVLPEAGVKGRGLVKQGANVLEYHTALALKAEDDYSRIDRIAEECEAFNRAWTGRIARKVPCIPDKPVMEDLLELDEVQELLKTRNELPIGYDYDTASPYCIDLKNTFSYLISGRAKSGKTNLLKLMIAMASKKKDMKLFVIDFSGKLKFAAEQYQAEYLDTDRKMFEAFVSWQPFIVEHNNMRKNMEGKGDSDSKIYNKVTEQGQICVFISDMPEFIQRIMERRDSNVDDMYGFLANITEKAAGLGIYFISAYKPEDLVKVKGNAIYNNLVKKKAGIHLGGNVAAQTILDFEYIPFKERGKNMKAGVAMLPMVDGELKSSKVVIPMVESRGSKE